MTDEDLQFAPDGEDIWAGFPDADSRAIQGSPGSADPSPTGGFSFGFGSEDPWARFPDAAPPHDMTTGPPPDAPRIGGGGSAAPSLYGFGNGSIAPPWMHGEGPRADALIGASSNPYQAVFALNHDVLGDFLGGPPWPIGHGAWDGASGALGPRASGVVAKSGQPARAVHLDPWKSRAAASAVPWAAPGVFTNPGAPWHGGYTAPSVFQMTVDPNGPSPGDRSRAVLSRDQVAAIVFNEIGGLSGEGFDDAARLAAHAIMNGDERYGLKRPKSATSDLRQNLAPEELKTLARIRASVDLVNAERSIGIDPTNGATYFNQNGNSLDWRLRNPYSQSRTYPTTLTQLDNPHNQGGLGPHPYAYTYADEHGVRFDPHSPQYPVPPIYRPQR